MATRECVLNMMVTAPALRILPGEQPDAFAGRVAGAINRLMQGEQFTTGLWHGDSSLPA